MIVGDAHVGEEHFVERRAPRHLAERSYLDTGREHVDDETGEALVLGQVGVGAADDLADLGVLRARRPHLLAVDDPLVAILDGAGLQAGEVRSRDRLAEELARHDVAARHHAEADGERGLARCAEAGLERVVGPGERPR